jgi:hypothetical protein
MSTESNNSPSFLGGLRIDASATDTVSTDAAVEVERIEVEMATDGIRVGTELVSVTVLAPVGTALEAASDAMLLLELETEVLVVVTAQF